MEAVDEPVSDEELGRLVRLALAAGHDEVPYSDSDMKRQVGMLLKPDHHAAQLPLRWGWARGSVTDILATRLWYPGCYRP